MGTQIHDGGRGEDKLGHSEPITLPVSALLVATAALFYAEPARTYDIDVFVLLGPDAQRPLVSLEPFYQWARTLVFGVDAEHILRALLAAHGMPMVTDDEA